MIANVQIYGLEESIIASGYPMSTSTSTSNDDIQLFKYWNSLGQFIRDFTEYQDNYGKPKGCDSKKICYYCGRDVKTQRNSKYGHRLCSKCNHQIERYGEPFETKPRYILRDDYVEIIIIGDKRREITTKISYESLPNVFYTHLSVIGNGYVKASGEMLHRFVLGVEDADAIVDHINRDILDNRLCNLRVCTKRQNCLNRANSKQNKSGISGVSWSKERGKWKAYINENYKQHCIGYFTDFRDAAIARLTAEKTMYKEFSPQRHLFKQYGILVEYDSDKVTDNIRYDIRKAINHYNRAKKLFSTRIGEAHDQALTGILVQFDLTLPIKVWTELQRYHFIDFVSSQSTMHRIAKFNLDSSAYSEYTDSRVIDIMNELKERYNADPSPENYLRLLYTNPCGFKLTARMTTNYRQLKTIYAQRHKHRLPEWREFCRWIETLPYSEWMVIPNE